MKTLPMLALVVVSGALGAQVPADVTLEPVPGTSGLETPLGLKHAVDGSGRLFVVEQGGTIRVIDGVLLDTPFVDISDRVESGGERGLLDIAFHPDFSTNGLFYLHYSAGPQRPPGTDAGDTIVAEFAVTADPNVADSEPGRIVLTVAQDFANHNGGQMRFGPDDGYLYLGLGDGGSGGDPCNRAQTLDPAELLEPKEGSCPEVAAALDDSRALLGKMLRIDVDNPTAAGDNTNLCGVGSGNPAEYSVPSDNPFADQPDRCGEVLFYGLRNPWRWSFDRATGDIWIGDVGQNQWEEIDLLEVPLGGGQNFGWNCFEASSTFSTSGSCPPASAVFPVLEYAHDNGRCSVTGGYRYRGPVTSLAGRYIFGDFCSGEIWFGDDDSGDWQKTLTGFNVGNIRSFGEDADGNVHVIAGSQLYRFEGGLIFADGFESP